MDRRSSTTQMADLNANLLAQNQQLKGASRTAKEIVNVGNNIQGQLFRQKEVIQKNIDKNQEIKQEIKKADTTTTTMQRRNFVVKAILWIVVILLFAANIVLIIYKLNKL